MQSLLALGDARLCGRGGHVRCEEVATRGGRWLPTSSDPAGCPFLFLFFFVCLSFCIERAFLADKVSLSLDGEVLFDDTVTSCQMGAQKCRWMSSQSSIDVLDSGDGNGRCISKPIDILIGCGVHRVTFPAPHPCYAHRSGATAHHQPRPDGNYELAAVHTHSLKRQIANTFPSTAQPSWTGTALPSIDRSSEAKHAAICRLVRLRVPLPARLGTALVG